MVFETTSTPEEEEEKGILATRKAEASGLLSANRAARAPAAPSRPTDGYLGRSAGTGFLGTDDGDTGGYLGRSEGSYGVPTATKKTTDMYSVVSHLSKEEEDGIATKTIDFLFGPEAAVIGIAHDSKGWSWNVDNMKQQWSEQPVWVNALATTSLVGTILFPAALAVKSSFKVGKMATKMKLGTLAETAEISTWKDMGMLADSKVSKYADLDPDTVLMLRKQEVAVNSYKRMKTRAERAAGGEDLNPIEKIRHEFDKRFAQTYNALVDDAANGGIKSEFHEMHNKLWQNDTVGTLLREMPDEKDGASIYAYMLGRIAPGRGLEQKALQTYGKLSAKNQYWADSYSMKLGFSSTISNR